MRFLFINLLVLVAAVALGVYAYQDPGYVLIARGKTSYQMTLFTFYMLAVITFGLLYLTLRIIARSWRLPKRLRRWRERRRLESARKDTNYGLIELAQGNWHKAEYYLIRQARNSDIPLLNYLSAARAAQKQNSHERRDEYLALAHKSMRNAGFAVELTQAELQLVHGQLEQALATLVHLKSVSPRHPHVLYLLARCYELLRGWKDLKELLPALKKHKVLDEDSIRLLEKHVHRELLTIATTHGKRERLLGAWQHIPKNLRHDSDLVRHYVRCLLTLECHDDAEILLRENIKRHWDVDLVYIYGLIGAHDKGKQLAVAESWIKNHESHPVLLLTLGRLCVRNQLWGKARSYLEASIGIQPRSDTYKELGQLMERLEEPQQAAKYYRQGLLLSADEKFEQLLTVAPARQVLVPSLV